MTEPYDALAECSRKVGRAFDREKDRYVELQLTNIKLREVLKDIANMAKDVSDEQLNEATDAFAARYRGELVVFARDAARAALEVSS